MKKQQVADRSKALEKRHIRNGILFLLPNIIGFMIFSFFPIVASLVISMLEWDGFNKPKFIGISNYIRLFSDEGFLISLGNTGVYTIFFVPITIILALLVAIALNSQMKGTKFYRTAFFLPYITATIAVCVVWQLLFHPSMGPINTFLMNLGIENPPKWLSSTKYAMPSVIIVSIWKNIGYYMILFLAGLQGIPKDLYEASSLDGADTFQKFKNVTLPMLSPITFFVIIIAVINSFKVFDMVYALTGGGPGRATNVLVYNIYNNAFQQYKFGYASAMAYVLFIIIMIVTVIQFRGQHKWVNE